MKQISIREQDEFIKLGQALKKADIVSSGVEAKIVIQDGQVTVNGETELQRGKIENHVHARSYHHACQWNNI